MRKAHKNEIFYHLLNHPLGIDNFQILDEGRKFRLQYKPIEDVFFGFLFEESGDFNFYFLTATSFEPGYHFSLLSNESIEFPIAFDWFKMWLNDDIAKYIEEKNTIDLWAEYQKGSNAITLHDEDYLDSQIFTSEEKDSIKLGLSEIKLLIGDRFDATDAQLELVNQRIEYLYNGVDRLDKTDYKGIFINTIISIMIALSLDSQKGQELYNLFMQVIRFMPTIGN